MKSSNRRILPPDLRIQPVSDVPHHWPQVAAIMEHAWPDWYGPSGNGEALADLRQRAQPTLTPDTLPYGWIACSHGVPVATVGLALTSYGAAGIEEGPWLIGLVTAPDARVQGIGRALIAHVAGQAAQHWPHIYTTTRDAAPLFAELGWQSQRAVDDAGWHVWRLVHQG